MSDYQHLRLDRDSRGVVTVTIDVAGSPVNVFNEALLHEVSSLVDELNGDTSARLIVFRSNKPSGFLAGADVHRIQQIASVDEAEHVLKLGQTLFSRIEALPAPTVAVIHGPCLGGGLEFALACRYRAARDDAATRIGLPETQLGLVPGWGGTQRLPRVVGATAAVQMILEGSRLTAPEAHEKGLVDAVLSPERFEEDLSAFLDHCLKGDSAERPHHGWLARLQDDTSLGQKVVLWQADRHIASKSRQYPALPAAIRAIEAGLQHGMEKGLETERTEFCRVLFDPSCRNLLEIFMRRERARKRSTWVSEEVARRPPIKSVAVLGAGTMGSGIAQLAATQGCSVWLMDLNDDLVAAGMKKIEALTEQAVRKNVLTAADAEKALKSITPTTEMESFAHADLVIEAVLEKMEIKQQAFRKLDTLLPPESLIASNTSALSIGEIGSVTGRTDRIAGLHFFNPVHKMPLVEIVRSPQTSDATVAALVDLTRQLGKTPIVVAEGPGFLVSRVLFQYLDEAVRLVGEGVAADQIDREAKQFGLPMGPLELLDLVGLDVSAEIAGTMRSLGLEESPTPDRLAEMVAAGSKGQKSGAGFYHYTKGQRGAPAVLPWAAEDSARLPAEVELGGEELTGLQQRLVFSLINSAADCVQEGIVAEPWMADLGMILGTGFPPFRGGPMTLIDHWGRDRVVEVLQTLCEVCGPRFRPSEFFSSRRPVNGTPARRFDHGNGSPPSPTAEHPSEQEIPR
ncbi:3-hydroxyacyl-CoA dehydrogenase NAD-binding domain-containing protein [Planctomyces sp. SH-PL14]|uniref:3-hydroxyacyl-CoA dehydrogenase NAD-binding domain-containing protein n=1 Tax=Planctomyces sp. SH-PL14 TaxID=1632864 RepID=UPI00078C7848|nr:3-hydroxyacyl-CoA dehydrogenase NAD-binding domain-containing protein [Planctomyces sp. SH-PL14]AMV19988.1 Fatty acid oxidation complex subunit alpha [Planctomyces sp. SH-PL14]